MVAIGQNFLLVRRTRAVYENSLRRMLVQKLSLICRIWKNMSLDDTLSDEERAKLAVWDYPVSDKYTKIWWTMKEANMPTSFEEGVQRVKESKGSQEGFAFIGPCFLSVTASL